MLNKTTILAVRALIHLSQSGHGESLSPRRIAAGLGASPTYMAKVLRCLVRGGILRAEKGAKGGVFLARAPESITLLSIYEVIQGPVAGSYCREGCNAAATCAYHQAAMQLELVLVAVLRRWTLTELSAHPHGVKDGCVMAGGTPAAQPGSAVGLLGTVAGLS